jgi:putative aldouronate transport system substrate-binding protein
MYKSGAIDKEFGVKSPDQIKEDFTAQKVGIEFGHWWNAGYPLMFSLEANPKADWVAYPLVSVDDKPAKPMVQANVPGFFVVNSKCKTPEAIYKMLNLYKEKYFTNDEAEYRKYVTDFHADGTMDDYQRLCPLFFFDLNQNPAMTKNVSAALKTGDVSKLTLEQKVNYDFLKDAEKRKNPALQTYTCYIQDTGSYGIMLKYIEGEYPTEFNQYYASNTALMAEKQPSLKKMEAETYTKIIMGSASVDEFDKFVENWNKLGGEAITQELNDWYAKNK